MRPQRADLPLVLVFVLFVLTASCGTSRAYIDYTMSGRIIWPGPPEKPRIRYLWSLQRFSGGKESRFLKFLAGGPESGDLDPTTTLVRPHGVFVDDTENLYVTDMGAARVNVVNLKTMESFDIKKAGGLPLLSPIEVVADPEGRIYVSDADNRKVAIFDEKGKFISFFEGNFKRPTGLAINAEKRLIYVTDTWEHAVYVYGFDGRRLQGIGGRGEEPGRLNYPTHIFVDRDGLIYVSDTLNFKVQVFSPGGTFLRAFGLVGDSYETFDKIKGIAVDSKGHVYVVDSAQDMVKIYDREGNLLLFFGHEGYFYGDFYLPAGIYIDAADRIYVADSLNRRVQAFQFLGGE